MVVLVDVLPLAIALFMMPLIVLSLIIVGFLMIMSMLFIVFLESLLVILAMLVVLSPLMIVLMLVVVVVLLVSLLPLLASVLVALLWFLLLILMLLIALPGVDSVIVVILLFPISVLFSSEGRLLLLPFVIIIELLDPLVISNDFLVLLNDCFSLRLLLYGNFLRTFSLRSILKGTAFLLHFLLHFFHVLEGILRGNKFHWRRRLVTIALHFHLVGPDSIELNLNLDAAFQDLEGLQSIAL